MINDDLLTLESLGQVDPDVDRIISAEESRQRDKLILIPSESLTPRPVREALSSVFTSIYAEGYPHRRTERLPELRLLDADEQLAFHRRYGDRRFYKGTEYADLIEVLAQKRVAELFATDGQPQAEMKVKAEEIFTNVQALSGAAANNAVYEALIQLGDTIMGMALTHGGHLSHGSPVNRSGKHYRVVSYGVDLDTGRLDYDEIERVAKHERPKIIIAGATAYPWGIDWKRLREIADEVPGGAYLLADVSHTAGLIAAGLFPNPIGYAHVTTFTTHKTLLGPRAATILTTDGDLARHINRAIFPGEQGGPHLHQIAAMAVAFGLARTESFRKIQRGIVENAAALAKALQERGLALACGGTSTHLLLVDLNSVKAASGHPLKGDVAARILDVCGLVCNSNTIPGDVSAGHASGIRLGTVWLTQRGFGTEHMEIVADLIHRTLANIQTFAYIGASGDLARGRMDFPVMQEVRSGVRELAIWAKEREGSASAKTSDEAPERLSFLEVTGERAGIFLQSACAGPILELTPGQSRSTVLLASDGQVMAKIVVRRERDDDFGRLRYLLEVEPDRREPVREWLEALSDGYVRFDPRDVLAKIDGPVAVRSLTKTEQDKLGHLQGSDLQSQSDLSIDETKPYFIGQQTVLRQEEANAEPSFELKGYDGPDRRTCLYEEHQALTGGKNMAPFAGWVMPLWYSGIRDEHRAVRDAAGLFDVTHMGVLEISGASADRFLDLVTTNYATALAQGQAHYSYVLDPSGHVIDDVFVYRRSAERFMMVVNAANAENVESWLKAVNERRCTIDPDNPGKRIDVTVTIRNLKDPESGSDRRVDIALQGPHSLAVLQALADPAFAERLARLRKSEFSEGYLDGIEAIAARTGYTGEEVGFELYIHPSRAAELWRLLLDRGKAFHLKPAGLGARDSLRVEAGFPLYGHELAGPYALSPIAAGYGAFVKFHKPFFIGRRALIAAEAKRTQQVVRFAMDAGGIRVIRAGDPVVNSRGQCIGYVTSCTAVHERQVGMAYLEKRYAEPGTAIAVFPLPRAGGHFQPAISPSELKPGEHVPLPESGRVLPRFGLQGLHGH